MASPEFTDLARRISILLDPPNSAIARTLFDHMPLSQPECLSGTNSILGAGDLSQIDMEEMETRVRSLATSGIVYITGGNILLTSEGLATAQFLRSCVTISTKDKD